MDTPFQTLSEQHRETLASARANVRYFAAIVEELQAVLAAAHALTRRSEQLMDDAEAQSIGVVPTEVTPTPKTLRVATLEVNSDFDQLEEELRMLERRWGMLRAVPREPGVPVFEIELMSMRPVSECQVKRVKSALEKHFAPKRRRRAR